MGYRCPVCGDLQADGVHLANHLAFTAIARGGDHEAWLDEHVPGWGEMGEDTLAARVREFAESAEYPTVFEDTTGHERGHDHAHGDAASNVPGHGHDTRQQDDTTSGQAGSPEHPEMAEVSFDASMDEEARTVVERAREMTRTRRENTGDSDASDDDARETDGTDPTTGSEDGQ